MDHLSEAYLSVYKEQQLDEISADTALAASKEAGKRAGIMAALGGDPKKVKEKRAQQMRLYAKQKEIRLQKEEIELIASYLLDEGFATSEQAASAIVEHMSDEWLAEIIEAYEGGKPLPPADKEALNKIRQRLQSMGKIEPTDTPYVPKRKVRKLEYEVK